MTLLTSGCSRHLRGSPPVRWIFLWPIALPHSTILYFSSLSGEVGLRQHVLPHPSPHSPSVYAFMFVQYRHRSLAYFSDTSTAKPPCHLLGRVTELPRLRGLSPAGERPSFWSYIQPFKAPHIGYSKCGLTAYKWNMQLNKIRFLRTKIRFKKSRTCHSQGHGWASISIKPGTCILKFS